MEYVKYDELFEQSQALFSEAKELVGGKDASAEDLERGAKLYEEGKQVRERSEMLLDLEARKSEFAPEVKREGKDGRFKSLGEMLTSIHGATFKSRYDPRLKSVGGDMGPHDGKMGWAVRREQDARGERRGRRWLLGIP